MYKIIIIFPCSLNFYFKIEHIKHYLEKMTSHKTPLIKLNNFIQD